MVENSPTGKVSGNKTDKVILVVSIVAVLLAVAYFYGKSLSQTTTPSQTSNQTNNPFNVSNTSVLTNTDTQTPTACDESLWQHIYHPTRLQVIDRCKSITGTIEIIRNEADGDKHVLLKLDSEFSNLLNEKNISQQKGYLVLEPVCVGNVTQEDAKDSCKDYISPITIPGVGSHVRVIGSYVLDKDHGWMELHPVSTFETL